MTLLLTRSHLTKVQSLREMSGTGKVVCVTGGSGFIASWIVKLLLARGYTVHATVRSLAKERLSLFEANLTEEGSFDSAFKGCECVIHTASPVLFSVNDPQAQLIEPAVKGTLNVLKSAKRVPCLKRVVLTSSMASVMFGTKVAESGVMVDETWFSDPLICEREKMWYMLSKTLAEETAVKFSQDNGLELVVINPGFVIGPLLQPTLNFTSESFTSLIKTGNAFFPDGIYGLVDVRDVAIAHISAFENPEANGRYIVVGNVVRSSDIMKIVFKVCPALANSEKEGKFTDPLPYNISRARAEGLGVEFTPMEVSINDTIESLMEKDLLIF